MNCFSAVPFFLIAFAASIVVQQMQMKGRPMDKYKDLFCLFLALLISVTVIHLSLVVMVIFLTVHVFIHVFPPLLLLIIIIRYDELTSLDQKATSHRLTHQRHRCHNCYCRLSSSSTTKTTMHNKNSNSKNKKLFVTALALTNRPVDFVCKCLFLFCLIHCNNNISDVVYFSSTTTTTTQLL